jgi:membrane-associated protease RseP (regulator of RpoE activity)
MKEHPMTIPRARLLVVLLAGSSGFIPVAAQAQATTVAASCSEGWSTLGSLGITQFTCDCTFDRGSSPAWRFRGEPVIRSVSSNGPAAGRLRPGDILVAIDGMLITTRAAGARLGNLKAGVPVVLTIRRGNRESQVRLTADEECEIPETPPVPTAASPRDVPTPRPPRSVAGAPVASTPADVAMPRPPRSVGGAPVAAAPRTPPPARLAPPAPPVPTAWFGFGISCHNCEMNVTNYSPIERAEGELRAMLDRGLDSDSPEVRSARARIRNMRRENTSWRFSEYPTLFSVDRGSPAYDAGLRRGDVLLRIDGLSLLTVEGASKFGQVEPGETVTFTYRRGGTERSVEVRAIERPSGEISEVSSEGLAQALAGLVRFQAERAQELEMQAARLQATLSRAAGGSGDQERALVELRAEMDRLKTTHSAESQAQLEKLHGELALVEQARAGRLVPSEEEQHLRFAGSVGNTEVEVRGLSSVEVSYDNSTGELLIRTLDSTIRVKAPPRR